MFELKKENLSETIENRARRIYNEVVETKTVKIGNETFNVNSVTLLKKKGVVSGWEIVVDGEPSSYDYVIIDRDERTYMTIRMKKPDVVLALGISPEGNNLTIIYDDLK